MIHMIPHDVSDGLRKETEVHTPCDNEESLAALEAYYPDFASYSREYLGTAEGKQFAEATRILSPRSRILDVGIGTGVTSIYLASLGHSVSSVEPCHALCRRVDRVSRKYGLEIDIFNVPGEFIDRFPGNDFVACIFNASLHHCDDPVRALKNCHEKLAPGGKILLLNEPSLQFFRSKAWFQRQLEQNTIVTGHYGGNEHTYYHHEYVSMLRQADFASIRDEVSLRYIDPRNYLADMQSRGVSPWRVVPRKLFYKSIACLLRTGPISEPLIGMLKKLSLLQTNFVATKKLAA